MESGPRRRALVALIVAALVVLVAARRPILTGYARRFVVDDPMSSDALVLLLGDRLRRTARAAELYQRGDAPLILMGRSAPNPRPGGLDENEATRRMLLHAGVPDAAIRILPGPAVASTRDESLRVLALVERQPLRRITLVTSPYHTARALWIFRRSLRGHGVEVHAAAACDPGTEAATWSSSPRGRRLYFVETIKTLYYRVIY